MTMDDAAREFDVMLAAIRAKIEHEGNPGDAWPDEYARYAINHGHTLESLHEWAHLVMVQPDPVHDAALPVVAPEPVAPSEAGVRRLAETLAAHTGADLSDPDTLDNYLFDARQLAPYMPHLLTYDERFASARAADLDRDYSWAEVAERGHLCPASPGWAGPHIRDETTTPPTCAECGATLD